MLTRLSTSRRPPTPYYKDSHLGVAFGLINTGTSDKLMIDGNIITDEDGRQIEFKESVSAIAYAREFIDNKVKQKIT